MAPAISIPNELWEEYRPLLTDLFREKTLKEVMNYMGIHKSFYASLQQYTRKYRSWGVKKFRKDEAWVAIDHEVAKRKRAGLESNVYDGDDLIPPEKVRRETLRHRPSLREVAFRASSPALPPGIRVCTPPRSEPRLRISAGWPENLPWTQFEAMLDSRDPAGPLSSLRSALASMPESPEETRLKLLRLILCVESQPSLDSSEILSAKLAAIMPIPRPEARFFAQMLLGQMSAEILCSLRKIMIYIMSNNLLKIDNEERARAVLYECRCILDVDFFIPCRARGILDIPTAGAFAEAVLHAALVACDVGVVQQMAELGLDPNGQRLFAPSPLQLAIKAGNEELVHFLIGAGADVSAKAAGSSGMLESAASTGNPVLVRQLLAAGARPTSVPLGRAVFSAVRTGSIETVRVLLAAGVVGDLHNALCFAARSDDMPLVQLLLSEGAEVDSLRFRSDDQTVLEAAADSGSPEMVRCFLSHGAVHTGNAILYASRQNNIEIVQLLLGIGAAVNCVGTGLYKLNRAAMSLDADAGIPMEFNNGEDCRFSTPLVFAARQGNVELVRLLCAAYAWPDGPGAVLASRPVCTCRVFHGTPLQIAAALGNIELAKALLDAGADFNAEPAFYRGRTVLQAAAGSGNLELVKSLVNRGARINAPAAANGGRTALQAAIELNDEAITNFLLQRGADVEGRPASENGVTALEAAILTKNDMLIELLLHEVRARRNSELTYPIGHTALAAAARVNEVGLVLRLLCLGTNPLNSDALYWSAENNNNMMFRALWDAALPILRRRTDQRYGYLALYVAMKRNQAKLVKDLLMLGVNVNWGPPPYELPAWLLRESKQCGTPLGWAVISGNHEMVQALLDAGAKPNLVYFSSPMPLGLAISAGDVSMVEMLLEKGTFDMGNEHLSAAISECITPMVKLLLGRLGSVSLCNVDPHQALLRSVAQVGDVEIVDLLLLHGAEVNVWVLAVAIVSGHLGIVHRLLKSCANTVDILQLWLNNGASIDGPVAGQCKRAVESAKRNGHRAASQFLRKFSHDGLSGDPTTWRCEGQRHHRFPE